MKLNSIGLIPVFCWKQALGWENRVDVRWPQTHLWAQWEVAGKSREFQCLYWVTRHKEQKQGSADVGSFKSLVTCLAHVSLSDVKPLGVTWWAVVVFVTISQNPQRSRPCWLQCRTLCQGSTQECCVLRRKLRPDGTRVFANGGFTFNPYPSKSGQSLIWLTQHQHENKNNEQHVKALSSKTNKQKAKAKQNKQK